MAVTSVVGPGGAAAKDSHGPTVSHSAAGPGEKSRRGRHQQYILCECPLTSRHPGREISCDAEPRPQPLKPPPPPGCDRESNAGLISWRVLGPAFKLGHGLLHSDTLSDPISDTLSTPIFQIHILPPYQIHFLPPFPIPSLPTIPTGNQ